MAAVSAAGFLGQPQTTQVITSLRNPQVQRLRRLMQSVKQRREAALIPVEGIKLVEECLTQGLQLVEAYVCPRLQRTSAGVRLHAELSSQLDVQTLGDRVMSSVSDVEAEQGVLVLVRPRGSQLQSLLESKQQDLLLAVGVQDPGNLGALMRVAEASHCAGLVSVSSCDVWSPKTLRGSAGSALRLCLVEESLDATLRQLETSGRRIFGTSSHAGVSLYASDLRSPFALLIGSEAGLPESALKRTTPLRIPMAGSVESLNLAVAAAVVLFEAQRQRGLK